MTPEFEQELRRTHRSCTSCHVVSLLAALDAERAAHAATREKLERIESNNDPEYERTETVKATFAAKDRVADHFRACFADERAAHAATREERAALGNAAAALGQSALAFEARLVRLTTLLDDRERLGGMVAEAWGNGTRPLVGSSQVRYMDSGKLGHHLAALIRAALDGPGPVLTGPPAPIETTGSPVCGTCARPLP